MIIFGPFPTTWRAAKKSGRGGFKQDTPLGFSRESTSVVLTLVRPLALNSLEGDKKLHEAWAVSTPGNSRPGQGF